MSERAGADRARPIEVKSRGICRRYPGNVSARTETYLRTFGLMTHDYVTRLAWSGSTSAGYRAYDRDHTVSAHPAEADLHLSADPRFRGDGERLNPEQLLVAAASSCQLLSFLAVAAVAGIDIRSYDDHATGTMDILADPARVDRIVLSPRIGVAAGTDPEAVLAAVATAHDRCYIANSLTTQVVIEATVVER
jgi:organic hydroperoxide reductase OsmC/OhrA